MKLTKSDFNYLSHTKMAWHEYGRDWSDHNDQGRFEPQVHNMEYLWGYWFIDYSAALLAKMYLEQEGIKYEMFSDEWSSDWVIVTDASII